MKCCQEEATSMYFSKVKVSGQIKQNLRWSVCEVTGSSKVKAFFYLG